MDKLERAHRLHQLLKVRRGPVSLPELCEALECKGRTVTRLISDMRELPDGGLELHIPYTDPTELIMEIARYGVDVEVVEPPELRRQVAGYLSCAAEHYT